MGDVEAIGLLLEELVFVMEDMNNHNDLSDSNFLFGLNLLMMVINGCAEQGIDLDIRDKQIMYMDNLIKNYKLKINKKYDYDKVHIYRQRLNECTCFEELYNLCDELIYGQECELNKELFTPSPIK